MLPKMFKGMKVETVLPASTVKVAGKEGAEQTWDTAKKNERIRRKHELEGRYWKNMPVIIPRAQRDVNLR